ncbi:DNA-binding response OmpR family regulator [Mucilaginibacter sp. SG538B]|uniref:response regulator transcription factor n=1 Tax=unclassified Mucilaginibacter TaxID=2617802 RepID=UPI0008713F5E|nr:MULTISPECIES: response regulator transcription factor [unclassified Mucilaginibacter]NVM67097.1 DNA-binding response OmpR family regulator [Mucilaginibacter sp. SG538B]SCW88303.1 hypothetical protein SAMN03159284_05364 [Mucilaginibacter sp. NFR10]
MKTVLLISNDNTSADTIKQILECQDYSVSIVDSKQLTSVEMITPELSLILLDIQHDNEASEFVNNVKEKMVGNRPLMVIADPREAEAISQLNAAYIFTRPFDLHEFITVTNKHTV